MAVKMSSFWLIWLLSSFLSSDSFVFPTVRLLQKPQNSQWPSFRKISSIDESRLLLSSTPTDKSPIESLSNECVRAVMASHDVGNEWGLETLSAELLWVGILTHPETSAVILNRYGIQKEEGLAVVQRILKADEVTTDQPKQPLPFGPDVKRVLEKACRIADKEFSSATVRSEHVLLALMGYNFGRPMTDGSVVGHVLQQMQLAAFEPKIFCNDLVQYMKQNPVPDETVVVKEEVVVIGKASTGATLAKVGVDLTQQAIEGQLDAVFGRDTEISNALRTLGRRRKNNPCLIGEPGVGKTAIAEGIAQILAYSLMQQAKEQQQKNKLNLDNINPFKDKNDQEPADPLEMNESLPPCPASLQGFRLISINLASLVAGTANRGDFEKRVQDLIEEASKSPVILFLDEVHQLVGTGGGGDGLNAANLLKPALARGEIRVLGATTTPEWRRYIEKDAALERRFQPLNVKEPSVKETLQILATLCNRYEEYHQVEYTNQALEAAAKLSDRYINDRFLPDKAIDLMDEAGSMMKMSPGDTEIVTEDVIQQVVAELTGIPVGRLDTGEKERLRNLSGELQARIKGQDTAVQAVSKAIRRARSGMRDASRPIASFLFCGPTGEWRASAERNGICSPCMQEWVRRNWQRLCLIHTTGRTLCVWT